MLNFEDERMLIDDIETKTKSEIINHFKIEEQAYISHYKQKELVYKTLYKEFIKRTCFLINVIKDIQELQIEAVNEKQQDANNFKERIKKLSLMRSSLEGNCKQLEVELSDKNDMITRLTSKLEEKECELELYRGDQKMLSKLELSTLADIENKFMDSLKCISRVKTKV